MSTKDVDQYTKLKVSIPMIVIYRLWYSWDHNKGFITNKLKTMCGLDILDQYKIKQSLKIIVVLFVSNHIKQNIKLKVLIRIQLKETSYDTLKNILINKITN